MSLQDDVNTQVAAIHGHLADAQGATLPDAATVSFNPITDVLATVGEALGTVSDALTIAADAIDALGGDSTALRDKIAEINSGVTAISDGIAGIEDASIDLSALALAATSHVGASAGLAGLLIDQSNFDGNVE